MGYGCVISLKQTIQHLLNSSKFSMDSSTREIMGFAYKEATSLQEELKRLHNGGGGKRLYTLDGQIREAAYKLEGFLELHQSCLFVDENNHYLLDSELVKQEVNLFSKTAKKLGKEYLDAAKEDENDVDAITSSSNTTSFDEHMIGFSDELDYMKSNVTFNLRPDEWVVVTIVGAVGTGRSLVAKEVFDHIRSCEELGFERCVWVRVGPIYERESILTQIGGGGEESARDYLVGQRYMVVLEDVCDTDILDYLLDNIFPKQNNASVVLVSTAAMRIGMHASPRSVFMMEDFHVNYTDMHWDTLRLVLFGLRSFPPELEEAGKKIVHNCRGLYLCLSKVLLYLCSAQSTPQAWNEIASDPHHPLFQVADEFSEIQKIKEDLANLTVEPDINTVMLSRLVDYSGIPFVVEFIKKQLFPVRFFPKMEVISVVGMAGIGKTMFVKKIFEYPQHFDCYDHWIYVWVSLGPKYQSEDILIDILAQIFPDIDKKETKGDSELANDFCRQLSELRLLIVLDDVWEEAPLRSLKKLFPNIKGKALVTTRFAEVAQSKIIDRTHEMRFLSEEESWDLLCQKVFGEGGSCPHELKKSGKKIAENCDGLPLTVIKVANLISKDLSPQYWNDVANKNSDFTNVLKGLSNMLLPCYDSLPLYLKPCFLYMGIFPQNYEVSTTKVLKLWISEGFLEPTDSSQTVEDFAAQCLVELVDTSLVMVRHKGSSSYGVKTFRLNSVLWFLSNSEAVKNKFFHAYDSIQGVKNQRRICIRNCILLSIKDIHDSMMDSVGTARSLICTGPYHQYQLPLCLELRLLRVLDTRVIRFYEFPIEVVNLIHLRHLAITCDGNLPPSISKLWNLWFLIVGRHLRINSSSSYLPMEIWGMKELRHLQVTGSSLPTPSCGTILPNLITLLDTSSHSCIEEVFEAIPNLEKLGIQIELEPGDSASFHYLNHISDNLGKLKSLKCVVVNPEVGYEVVAPEITFLDAISYSSVEEAIKVIPNPEMLRTQTMSPDDAAFFTYLYHMSSTSSGLELFKYVVMSPEVGFKVVAPPPPIFMFPLSLEKLSLSGLGYPWEYMNIIGELENLRVLKLRCYAFLGDKWETGDHAFKKLKHLIIEDTDLVWWRTTNLSFSKLKHLSIKHCYNLEELPYRFTGCETIEVVDCNPFAVKWAKVMRERNGLRIIPTTTDTVLQTRVESSWDVGQPQYQRKTPYETPYDQYVSSLIDG